MKVAELMKIDHLVLELLQKSCVNISDVRYVSLYEEYMDIVSRGGKKAYAVAVLSERYGISERKVYYLVKKLSQDCKILAV